MSERHRRYLAALGIPLWVRRTPATDVAAPAPLPAAESVSMPPAGALSTAPPRPPSADTGVPLATEPRPAASERIPAADASMSGAATSAAPAGRRPATPAAPAVSAAYAESLPTVTADAAYEGRSSAAVFAEPAATPLPEEWALWAELAGETDTGSPPADEPAVDSRAARIAAMDWDTLAQTVRGCEACGLCRTRAQTVFGTGNRRARWMVIGEAPGAEEDRQGEPFVGQAGQLLNAMLKAIGLAREEVFIANVLKCRPPQNRDPAPAEAAACRPFLERQIELVQPDIILSVGRISAHNLLATDVPVGKLRGRVFHHGTRAIPLIVTYHPAYLLRAPLEKRKAWDDLELACAQIDASAGTRT